MDKALYLAMTGAKHNMRAQVVHSNNLANANTSGFKAEFEVARAMPVYYGDGHPTRAYALAQNPAANLSQGALLETGNELDLAINGQGYFAVQLADGREVYTRAGNLQVDAVGILRDGNGLAVLGQDGLIALPSREKVEVGQDGSITVVVAGEGPTAPAQLDRIRLVTIAADNIEKDPSGYFRTRDGEDAAPDAQVTVTAGFLEASNVNLMEEFTAVLSLARQYELQVKLMKTVESNSESTAQLLQVS